MLTSDIARVLKKEFPKRNITFSVFIRVFESGRKEIEITIHESTIGNMVCSSLLDAVLKMKEALGIQTVDMEIVI